MATGEVDLNWAKEHHDHWLEKQLSRESLALDPDNHQQLGGMSTL